MFWTKVEEKEAKKEYELLIKSLTQSGELKNDWKGHWDDVTDTAFGRTSLIKGDKHTFMKNWIRTDDILNDKDWDKINIEDYGDF